MQGKRNRGERLLGSGLPPAVIFRYGCAIFLAVIIAALLVLRELGVSYAAIFRVAAALVLLGCVQVPLRAFLRARIIYRAKGRKFSIRQVEAVRKSAIWPMMRPGGFDLVLVGTLSVFGVLSSFRHVVWPILWYVTYRGASVLYVLQPPVVLVLSSSASEKLQFLVDMYYMVNPLRLVALLDHDLASDAWTQLRAPFLSLRTRRDNEWRQIVTKLINSVPVIVLDGRTVTDAILFEARALFAAGRMNDTLVVTDPDGACQLLSVLAAAPDCSLDKSSLSLKTERETLETLVQELGWT